METIIGKLLYIYRKLKEPSTHAALSGIMTAFSLNIPDDKLKAVAGGAAIVFLNAAASQVGYIYTTSTATQYNTSSDYRLKENIEDMVGATDRLKALKPINFAWKADGHRVDGFLAHELQEVVPEAATGTKDEVDEEGNPVYQGIDQSKLVPLLTKALQEAVARIEALEAKLGGN